MVLLLLLLLLLVSLVGTRWRLLLLLSGRFWCALHRALGVVLLLNCCYWLLFGRFVLLRLVGSWACSCCCWLGCCPADTCCC
ncbi:hypothetical protein COO60DRAFT_1474949 [Scenedesmus sp. NREL 46B-D3]|nr:hypothetical protein COO60DRAFT_1474949 [Scenedesmus sp. NREL 46B-D3]